MNNKEIICKLTLKKGKFVKSHLLPRALTNLHKTQESRIEIDFQGKNRIAHDSWYDYNLCTEEGEKILSKLDEFGIEELREHNLTWDSWGIHKKLRETTSQGIELIDGEDGIRVVKFSDLLKIKIFFLSLLWRVSASNRKEMEHVSLTEDEIEKLRLIINEKQVELVDYFPITLIQLSTKGPIHNRVPYTEFVEFEEEAIIAKQARIYIDGLIIRISINIKNKNLSLMDAKDKNSLIICKCYDESLQKVQIEALVEAHTNPLSIFKQKDICLAISNF